MRLILFVFLVVLVALMVYLWYGRSRLRHLHGVLEQRLVALTAQADEMQTFVGLVQGATRKRAQQAEDRLTDVTTAVAALMDHINSRQLGLGHVLRQGREVEQCERTAAELDRTGRELAAEIALLRKLESRVKLQHEELHQELHRLKTTADDARLYHDVQLPRWDVQLDSLDNDLQVAGELAFFDPVGASERMAEIEGNLEAMRRQIRQ